MRKTYLAILAAMLLIAAAVAATAVQAGDNGNGKEKVRVIAHTDKEISDAVSQGCKVVRDAKTLKALVCDKDAAISLGLQEDIQVFAVDTGANTQIRADMVQASGNTGTGRKVVVLDTGYNYLHPELISSYLGGKDFVNNDLDPMDDNGHGSHVAGLITADGVYPSAKGVAPNAGIISGKVLSASGSGFFSDVVAAIYWAVDGPDGIANTPDDFNADAISISLGSSPPYTYAGFCDGVLPDLTNAIRYAINRGVIVVVAAGNSGTSGVSIPGCISYSTTVGAVNSADNIASFSGIGTAVDISAPGVNLVSSWLGSGYYTASGTSMATPVVSGVAALIKFAHPGYTVAQTQSALFNNAKDLGIPGKDSTYGWGRVDAYASVGLIHDVAVTSISAPSSAPQGTPVNIGVNVANQGSQQESFIVTVMDETDSVLIGSQGVSLSAGSSTTLGFTWNTSASSAGGHTIKAQAGIVPGETDVVDNVKTAVVTIVAPDTAPPVISGVAVSGVTDTRTTITWNTDEPSDSMVRYGTGTIPSTVAYNSTPVTGHSITLTGLSAGTTYRFEVQSTDSSSNTAVDNNGSTYYSFTTAATAVKTMHVANIVMSTTKVKSRTYATAAVTIVNATGAPVGNANVSGHWSNLTSDSDSGYTDASGRVALRSDQVRTSRGTFTFTVDNVVLSGWVYKPEENIETSDSITI
ncbi:MAG: S8 family serine peptidase [Candidatus Methanoperedens sp.]